MPCLQSLSGAFSCAAVGAKDSAGAAITTATAQARNKNWVLNRLSFRQSNLPSIEPSVNRSRPAPTLAGRGRQVRPIIVVLVCGASLLQGVQWPLGFKFPCDS